MPSLLQKLRRTAGKRGQSQHADGKSKHRDRRTHAQQATNSAKHANGGTATAAANRTTGSHAEPKTEHVRIDVHESLYANAGNKGSTNSASTQSTSASNSHPHPHSRTRNTHEQTHANANTSVAAQPITAGQFASLTAAASPSSSSMAMPMSASATLPQHVHNNLAEQHQHASGHTNGRSSHGRETANSTANAALRTNASVSHHSRTYQHNRTQSQEEEQQQQQQQQQQQPQQKSRRHSTGRSRQPHDVPEDDDAAHQHRQHSQQQHSQNQYQNENRHRVETRSNDSHGDTAAVRKMAVQEQSPSTPNHDTSARNRTRTASADAVVTAATPTSKSSMSHKKGFLFRSNRHKNKGKAHMQAQTQAQNTATAKSLSNLSKAAVSSSTTTKAKRNEVLNPDASEAESSLSSAPSASATLVPSKDGTFVSSATMKRRQRISATSGRKKTFGRSATRAVASSFQAAKGMMAFRKSKRSTPTNKATRQGTDDEGDDDDDAHDDDVDLDLLCRTVQTPTRKTRSNGHTPSASGPASKPASSPTKRSAGGSPHALSPAEQRAQRRETERIARAAAALDAKGNLLFEKGYYDKAMETYTKALRLKRRTFHTLLDEADDILDEALEGENLVRNPEKADAKLLVSMATSINNIGYLRQRSGEATHDETMAAYKKSLRIKREILGKDSLSVGKTLNNIGSVHYLRREFSNALLAYSEALQIMQSNLGEDDKDVATVWSNMGDVHWAIYRCRAPDSDMESEKEHALEHYRQALNIRWDRFGEHDPRVVRLLEKIAAIEMGDKMLAQSSGFDPNASGAIGMDDDDVMDLDNRPVGEELQILHNEVQKDMIFVDLMQKRLKVDMVKDKVNILRGIRLLEDTARRQMQLMTLKQQREQQQQQNGDAQPDNSNSTSADGPVDARTLLTSESYESKSTHMTLMEREVALQSVKDRLAKLRKNRGFKTSKEDSQTADDGDDTNHGDGDDGTGAHAAADQDGSHNAGDEEREKNTGNTITATLCGAALYKAQFQRPILSSFEGNELKRELDSLRSALVLKRGIESLRSFSVAG